MGSARNYATVEKSVKSQVPAIFMYRMHHVFPSLVPVSSLFRRQLAYTYIIMVTWCNPHIYDPQTSSDLDSRVVYVRNTPCNHDLYIT